MEEINIKTLLPVGEKLKPLLSKSCISEADLKGILAERGVFIGDNSTIGLVYFFRAVEKVPLSLAACKSNNRSGSRTYRTE